MIRGFIVLGGCVLHQIGGQPLNVIIVANVGEGIVAMAPVQIDQVNHLDCIPLCLQQIPGIPKQLSLGIQHHIRAVRLHDVGLGIAERLTSAGTADHQHIYISAVYPSIQSNGHILRENLVDERILCGVLPVDFAGTAPFRRTMLFPTSVILVIGCKTPYGNQVDEDKNKDSPETALA